MDFERVLGRLLDAFDKEGVSYALMGGFALGALGAPRATMDLDFLIRRDDLKKLEQVMGLLGYQNRYRSENVSQYVHKDIAWGALDFIHAFRSVSMAMLARAVEKPVFGGARSLRVLQPEDVIGLKVQAMTNDPERRARETADIEALLSLYRGRLDWGRMGEFYSLFGLGPEFSRLRERFER